MIVQKYKPYLIRPLELFPPEGSILQWLLYGCTRWSCEFCELVSWVLQISICYCPKMFEFDKIVLSCTRTPRTATVMTFLKYGHPPVVSTMNAPDGLFTVLVFPECNILLYWNLIPAYMYVRSKNITTGGIAPSNTGLGRRTYCQRLASWCPLRICRAAL